MTSAKEAEQGKDASTAIASKSRSPSKDKSSSAPGSDAPARTSKKRRKVNHGKTTMLCLMRTYADSFAPKQRASTVDVR